MSAHYCLVLWQQSGSSSIKCLAFCEGKAECHSESLSVGPWLSQSQRKHSGRVWKECPDCQLDLLLRVRGCQDECREGNNEGNKGNCRNKGRAECQSGQKCQGKGQGQDTRLQRDPGHLYIPVEASYEAVGSVIKMILISKISLCSL